MCQSMDFVCHLVHIHFLLEYLAVPQGSPSVRPFGLFVHLSEALIESFLSRCISNTSTEIVYVLMTNKKKVIKNDSELFWVSIWPIKHFWKLAEWGTQFFCLAHSLTHFTSNLTCCRISVS